MTQQCNGCRRNRKQTFHLMFHAFMSHLLGGIKFSINFEQAQQSDVLYHFRICPIMQLSSIIIIIIISTQQGCQQRRRQQQ